MFYSLLLMTVAWSCMNHGQAPLERVENSSLLANAIVLSKVDQELDKKVADLKGATRRKALIMPAVHKGNIASALDDAIAQLADNGKCDTIRTDRALKQEVAVTRPVSKEAIDVIAQLFQKENVKSQSQVIAAPEDLSQHADAMMSSIKCLDNYETEDTHVVQTRKINVGGHCNSFYIDNDDEPKRFAIIGSVYNTFCLDRAFNDCKKSVPMAQQLFGAPSFTIADIFLLSRLSQTSHLYTSGVPGTSLSESAQMANAAIWQYLALVAPTQVVFDADAHELGADISFVYRFNFGKCIDVACSVGINIPVICRTHELDLRLINSNLYSQIPYAAGDTTVRDSTLTLFFNEFVSIEDFFYRAVLAPKGLTLDRKQQMIGFGDVSLFSTFDFAPSIECVDGLQVGFNLSLPTSPKPKGNSIWEIQLGSGAVQLDLFANVIFNGGTKYFNPTVYIAGEFGFAFTNNGFRAPKIVSHVSSAPPYGQEVDAVTVGTPPDGLEPNIPGLIVPGAPSGPGIPEVFTQYYTTTFSEVDSKVRFFADSVNQARIKQGAKVIIGVGNYFYATRDCQMRLGVFYDFTAKSADDICVFNCGGVSTKFDLSLYNCMSEYAQRISWHAAYKLGCCGEFMIGSQHVVAGKNVFKTNQAFATFVAIF